MAEDIERTIFKLEIDGSAYVDGANKLTESTKKISEAQEKANIKLLQLKENTRTLKDEVKKYTTELKENEKEITIASNKLSLLNSLSSKNKEAVAAATAELAKYTAIQKDIKDKITSTNVALDINSTAIKKQAVVLKEAEKGTDAFTGGLKKAYAGLGRIANLIPGLGIAGLVALVAGPLVNAFKDWIETLNSAGNKQKILKEITDNAIKGFTAEVTHLGFIREKLNDLNIPQEKRIALAKDYNRTAEEGNRIDLKQIDNIDLLNKAIDRQIQKIKERAFAKAAENIVTEKAEKLFLAQSDLETKFPEQSDKIVKEITDRAEAAIKDSQKRLGIAGKINVKELLAFADLPEEQLRIMAEKNKRFAILLDVRTGSILQAAQRELKAIQDYRAGTKAGGAGVSIAQAIVDQAKKDLDDALEAAKGFITIEGLFTDRSKQAINKIENIYERELQRLKADIAKLDEKGFTNEETIRKAIEEDFAKREQFFREAFKKKQLTSAQLADLNNFLKQLQDLTLEQNLKSFREAKAAYLAQIQAELDTLQIEEATKRISTIQDRFERERQMIISETEKTANDVGKRRDKRISEIINEATKHGLTPADVAPQINQIKTIYSKLLDDIEVIKLQKLQQLSFDTFERLSEDAKRLLDSGNLGISQGSLLNIQAQAKLLSEGKISFQQYQKELTAIARFEVNERFRLEKLFLEQEIAVRKAKLASDKSLTDDQIKKLEDEIRRLQQQLADATKGNVTANINADNAETNAKIENFVKYAQAIGNLTSSIISFWAQTNQAEQAALDRSIALQEKRVDAAQRIAERGNAQYLKMEQDRLTELNVQRENAARKQLGINAALQGSEILVSLISGIAQAVKTTGPLGAIIAVTAVAAALAGAFAIAQSLKPPTPSFFVGTKDTGQGGNKDAKGGFAATLHPGEAVIPSDRNKAYKPAISAIYDRTVPAEALNNFVKNYHQIKTVPLPDYSRIKDAAEISIGSDGRMSVLLTEQNKKMDENTHIQKQVLRALKTMGVNVNMDKNGIAVSVLEAVEQIKINSRA